MTSGRLITIGVALALVATACGAASSGESSSAGSSGTAEQAAAADTATVEPFDLVRPTETDRPFDLSGGTISAEEVADSDDLVGGLDPGVAQATAPWDTLWAQRTVDLSEFQLGIQRLDPRDVIRPIDQPAFEPLSAATWLAEREPGALVQFNDQVRFYPLSILTRHEIVNDRFGDIPVVVSFCPLCNTAVTFDARVDGQVLRFGVSGLLRNSDLVMWDDATTSLWQQITGEAVVGEFAGTQLDLIPTSIVSYGDALKAFPDALSLSQETGFNVAYGANPYESYSTSQRPFLFAGDPDPRFPALSRVVGVNLDGADKAYPFSLIEQERAVNDEVDGTPIVVLWGGDTADALDSGQIADGRTIGTGIAFDRRVNDRVLTFSHLEGDLFTDAETGSTWTLLGQAVDGELAGESLETVQHRNEFWFAWASFFPDAAVYSGS